MIREGIAQRLIRKRIKNNFRNLKVAIKDGQGHVNRDR
jgi:hypothetical protein